MKEFCLNLLFDFCANFLQSIESGPCSTRGEPEGHLPCPGGGWGGPCHPTCWWSKCWVEIQQSKFWLKIWLENQFLISIARKRYQFCFMWWNEVEFLSQNCSIFWVPGQDDLSDEALFSAHFLGLVCGKDMEECASWGNGPQVTVVVYLTLSLEVVREAACYPHCRSKAQSSVRFNRNIPS